MKAIITRDYHEKQTLGAFSLYEEYGETPVFTCKTLELPKNDNIRRKSCIPPGIYEVIPRYSEKFKKHYHVLNVPNRDFILIHPANWVTQLLGCIAVGDSFKDLNNDEMVDITNSRKTLNKILSLAPEGFTLEIW